MPTDHGSSSPHACTSSSSANPSSAIPCEDSTKLSFSSDVPTANAGSSHDAIKPDSCWSSLFSFEKATHLHYHHPLFANGKHSVFISKSVHDQGISVWEDC